MLPECVYGTTNKMTLQTVLCTEARSPSHVSTSFSLLRGSMMMWTWRILLVVCSCVSHCRRLVCMRARVLKWSKTIKKQLKLFAAHSAVETLVAWLFQFYSTLSDMYVLICRQRKNVPKKQQQPDVSEYLDAMRVHCSIVNDVMQYKWIFKNRSVFLDLKKYNEKTNDVERARGKNHGNTLALR